MSEPSKNVKTMLFLSKIILLNCLLLSKWPILVVLVQSEMQIFSKDSVTGCLNKKLPKVCPKRRHNSFYLKCDVFYSSLESCKIFGVLCSKICSQELSKIAQFGHTVQLSKESFITLTIGPDLISSFTGSLFSLHERRLSRRQKIIRPRFF